MSRLFQRTGRIIVAKPTGFFQQGGNAIEIRDLRIRFDVQKTIGKEPNTCEVVISNLKRETRTELSAKPLHVRVEAGYDGAPQQVFVGDLRWSESVHRGVDWETKLDIGDGERALKHARVNRAFKPGVKARDAVREVATSMGLTVPRLSTDIERALDNQFVSGLSLSGSASRELTRLVQPYGIEWSVQDGRLQLLAPGEVRADRPIVINQDAGMIGVPEYGSPPEKKKPPTLTVQTLLLPAVTPGGKIFLDTRSVKGLFKVQKVRHQGDTHGSDWSSTIEATPVN